MDPLTWADSLWSSPLAPLLNPDSAMHDEPKAVKIANYIRGVFEGLGLGALYILPDLLVTIHRFATSPARSPENLRAAGCTKIERTLMWNLPERA